MKERFIKVLKVIWKILKALPRALFRFVIGMTAALILAACLVFITAFTVVPLIIMLCALVIIESAIRLTISIPVYIIFGYNVLKKFYIYWLGKIVNRYMNYLSEKYNNKMDKIFNWIFEWAKD